MLNHEDIYQLILNEEWQEILELLHTRKKEMLSDSLLQLTKEHKSSLA